MSEDVSGIVGIDPDAPIYRIFNLWAFQDLLRSRRARMVQPKVWDDPLENLVERVVMDLPDGRKLVSMAEHARMAYAQCWSATRESDTLWRAYSRVAVDPRHGRNMHPGEEGVKAKTTPRKLLRALRGSIGGEDRSFVGAARYMDEERLKKTIADRLFRHGHEAFMDPVALRDFHLLKRDAFSHEAEARLLLVMDREKERPMSVEFEVDPNELFEEIEFDPRLVGFERSEREQSAKSLGYEGKCHRSPLYVQLMLHIDLTAGSR